MILWQYAEQADPGKDQEQRPFISLVIPYESFLQKQAENPLIRMPFKTHACNMKKRDNNILFF